MSHCKYIAVSECDFVCDSAALWKPYINTENLCTQLMISVTISLSLGLSISQSFPSTEYQKPTKFKWRQLFSRTHTDRVSLVCVDHSPTFSPTTYIAFDMCLHVKSIVINIDLILTTCKKFTVRFFFSQCWMHAIIKINCKTSHTV